jgi:hypothetical protein
MNKIILFTIILVITVVTLGATYKWVDSEGRVHYSDQPTDSYKSKEVDIEPGPSKEEVDEAQERAQQLINNQDRRNEARQRESEEKQAEHEGSRQDQRCDALREKLWALKNQKLRVYSDFPGGPRKATDKERKAMINDVEAEIRKSCK